MGRDDAPTLDGDGLAATLVEYRRLLAARRDQIDAINVFPIADADTGRNLFHTVAAAAAETTAATGRSLEEVASGLAESFVLAGRGASGLILSQALAALCTRLAGRERAGGSDLAAALGAAAAAARAAVADPVDGTMLSAAADAAAAALRSAAGGGDAHAVARAGRDAAWDAVAESPQLLPVLREAAVVDAGAVGYALFLDALVGTLDSEPVAAHVIPDPDGAAAAVLPADRYEIVAVTAGLDDPADGVSRLGPVGSSVVVSAGRGRAKIHLHCADPVRALAAITRLGAVEAVELTDLHRQARTVAAPAVLLVALHPSGELVAAGADRALAPPEPGRLIQALDALGDGAVVVAVGDAFTEVGAAVGALGRAADVRSAGTIGDAVQLVAEVRAAPG